MDRTLEVFPRITLCLSRESVPSALLATRLLPPLVVYHVLFCFVAFFLSHILFALYFELCVLSLLSCCTLLFMFLRFTS